VQSADSRVARSTVAVTTLLVAAVLLAACGGSSKNHATNASATAASDRGQSTATAPATATTRRPRPSSRAALSARLVGASALLRLSDLPSGFAAGPRIRTTTPSTVLRRAAPCFHVPISELRTSVPREVTSRSFVGPGATTIGNSITVLHNEAQAQRFAGYLQAPQASSCLAQGFAKAFARSVGKAAGTVSFTRIPLTGGGAQGLALRIQIHVQGKATSWLDAVALRVGRATASLSFSAPRSPVSASLERSLTALTVGRLQAALSAAG
jgi:hypothetical protein